MDARTAAHALSQIAAHLELKGENTFKVRAYESAARGLAALNADDLAPLYDSGDLGKVRGLVPQRWPLCGTSSTPASPRISSSCANRRRKV